MLIALWKSGKTTLITHLLREMARGGQVGEIAVAKAKVLIISEEVPDMWNERRQDYTLGDNIDLICIPFKTKPSKKEWQRFLEYIDTIAPMYNLIVIDTLADIWPVLDENNNSEVIEAIKPIRSWAANGTAVLVMHHARKGDTIGGQASRGAGGLPAFVDTIIEVHTYSPGSTRRVLRGFSRHKETPAEVVIELDGDKYILLGDKSDIQPNNRLNTILELLPRGEPGLTKEEIMEDWPDKLKPSESTLKRDLRTLCDKGKVFRGGKGVKGESSRYWV